ncbi:MAG: SRPBCC domain-containing protein [Phycisphaerae bacterium]|nr:SRPBCC domain-containing protein [Phycisphaerae bacterium]
MAEKVYSIDIDAPVKTVWDEVTSTGRVQRHMFDCVLDHCDPGKKYLWHDKPRKHVFVRGEIVESTPPSGNNAGRLVQTFKFTTLPDDYSLVTWDFIALGPARTKVTVTHTRLDPEGKTITRIDGGWPSILKALKSVCETGNVPLKTRLMYFMMRNMSFVLPKSTRIEQHQD